MTPAQRVPLLSENRPRRAGDDDGDDDGDNVVDGGKEEGVPDGNLQTREQLALLMEIDTTGMHEAGVARQENLVGHFATAVEAARAYDREMLRLWGDRRGEEAHQLRLLRSPPRAGCFCCPGSIDLALSCGFYFPSK